MTKESYNFGMDTEAQLHTEISGMTENNLGKGENVIESFLKDAIEEADKLYEENEQLKREYQKLKHRHSLLHDVCLDAECERDSLKKDVESLEKENKELKQELLEAIDDLSEKRPNKKGFAGNGRFA